MQAETYHDNQSAILVYRIVYNNIPKAPAASQRVCMRRGHVSNKNAQKVNHKTYHTKRT
jgi:hypothetical protein